MEDVPGLLATLAGMLVMIAIGALQLRRPAVSRVEVVGEVGPDVGLTDSPDVGPGDGEARLVVRLPGWDGVWAMKRSVKVPLLQVAHVTASDAADVPRRGMRMPGTALPGVIRSGSYGSGAQRELWNVRRATRVLVIDLDPAEPYARIVLEVADPDGLAERLREALAAARSRPR